MREAATGGRARGRNVLDRTRDFERLFATHRAAILGYAARRGPFDDAKDVVAETFLVAWRRFETIPDDPLPWLFAVARNVIATRSRKAARRARLLERLEEAESSAAPPATHTERRELVATFMELSEKDREILMLVAWDGLTVAQAAASLGWPPSRFSVRLHRARRRLAARLDNETETPFLNAAMSSAEETR